MLKKVKSAAGFSLGEYSALVFGGAMSFADGLKVVKVRAEAMHEAAQAASSGMASIGPLDDDKLLKVLDDAAAAVGNRAHVSDDARGRSADERARAARDVESP